MRPDETDPIPPREQPRPFSFGSLLAVGLFLMVVVALVLPAMQRAHETGSPRTCRNNLKQIGLAFHNYHDDFSRFPAQASEEPAHSWRVALLPYVDQAALHKQYDRMREWNSTSNWPLALETVPVYSCPASSVLRKD